MSICYLSAFQIDKVIDSTNNQEITVDVYSQYFSLTADGFFEVLDVNTPYSNYHVYISAGSGPDLIT